MSEPPLPLEPSGLYHMRTHADSSSHLFRKQKSYEFFLNQYWHYADPVVETFAYCLMPNHLDLMVKVRTKEEVLTYLQDKKMNSALQAFEAADSFANFTEQQFNKLFNYHEEKYNEQYDREAEPLDRQFRWKSVGSAEYFLQLIVFIHNAPVHHGLAEHPDEWPYSSWQHLYS